MPKKVDANQSEIVAALRAVGATVQSIHTVGHGCPDLAVGYRGQTFFLEVKAGPKEPLTPDEAAWIATWRGHVQIVWTVEHALETIGAM